jgi:hypothetical protein
MSCTTAPVDTVEFLVFAPDIQLRAKGIPDAVAESLAREAAIDFIRRTHTLKRTLLTDAQAGVGDYYIDLPDGLLVRSVSCVTLDGRPLRSVPQCTGRYMGSGFSFDGQRLFVSPAPCEDSPGALEVTVYAVPTQTTCALDRDIYEQYADAIVNGALSRAFAMHGASWANAGRNSLMRDFQRLYLDGVNRAKRDQNKGLLASPTQARAPRWL